MRLSGTGKDQSGSLKSIHVEWKVAEFGERKEWHLLSIMIDGDTVYEKPP